MSSKLLPMPVKSPVLPLETSVMDLECVEELDEEVEVPGTLEIVAGEDMEPSLSRVSWRDFT